MRATGWEDTRPRLVCVAAAPNKVWPLESTAKQNFTCIYGHVSLRGLHRAAGSDPHPLDHREPTSLREPVLESHPYTLTYQVLVCTSDQPTFTTYLHIISEPTDWHLDWVGVKPGHVWEEFMSTEPPRNIGSISVDWWKTVSFLLFPNSGPW